jgi:hypothetical protein
MCFLWGTNSVFISQKTTFFKPKCWFLPVNAGIQFLGSSLSSCNNSYCTITLHIIVSRSQYGSALETVVCSLRRSLRSVSMCFDHRDGKSQDKETNAILIVSNKIHVWYRFRLMIQIQTDNGISEIRKEICWVCFHKVKRWIPIIKMWYTYACIELMDTTAWRLNLDLP